MQKFLIVKHWLNCTVMYAIKSYEYHYQTKATHLFFEISAEM